MERVFEFPSVSHETVKEAYESARLAYASLGVDVDAATERARQVPVSIHVWQGDDVVGLETKSVATDGGGIMATGNYGGKPRNGDELRADLEKVISLVPGMSRVNVHASYAETGEEVVDRNALEVRHFAKWINWAKRIGISLDFNPTFFAHPKADDGFTLSNADAGIRDFWIEHGIACRKIGEAMGKELGSPCVVNVWIPDGCKDSPADRWSPRERLVDSLDKIFGPSVGVDEKWVIDSVESKLFGLGSEDYVVGSHEFYLGYSLTRGVAVNFDMGHFHPTETIHDKLSAVLQYTKRVVLHISRPVRWDSDHVVLFNDDVRNVFLEVCRGNALEKVFVALDFFDASINRIGAYVIGARAVRKAILYALLEPAQTLQRLEAAGRGAEKLALMEEMKTMPFGAVWDNLCISDDVPASTSWMSEIQKYENDVLSKRS